MGVKVWWVVVGFKVSQDKSVVYKKVSWEGLKEVLVECEQKGCDFISVRLRRV